MIKEFNNGDIIWWESPKHIFYGVVIYVHKSNLIYTIKAVYTECKLNADANCAEDDPSLHKSFFKWGFTTSGSNLSLCDDPQKISTILETLLKI